MKTSKKEEKNFEVRICSRYSAEEAKKIIALLKANSIKAKVFEYFEDLPF